MFRLCLLKFELQSMRLALPLCRTCLCMSKPKTKRSMVIMLSQQCFCMVIVLTDLSLYRSDKQGTHVGAMRIPVIATGRSQFHLRSVKYY